jgi:tetratricopeptide (TPR) repeat protein
VWWRISAAFALLGSYNSIVTRIARMLAALFFVSLVPAFSQQPNTAPDQQKQQQAAPPQDDEQNPPEEDESVAPEKFVLNPLESDRNVRVGNFYMRQGSRGYRAALARYERATKFNPSNAEAFFKVGEVEEKLKDPDKAKAAFQRVIQVAPDSKFAREAKKKLANVS